MKWWPFKKKETKTSFAEIDLPHVKYCPTCRTTLKKVRHEKLFADLWCPSCEYQWTLHFADNSSGYGLLSVEVFRSDLPGAMDVWTGARDA